MEPFTPGSATRQGRPAFEAAFLAFASPGTKLSTAQANRFAHCFELPALPRNTLWELFAYGEILNLLGATTLTVGNQMALSHALAGSNVLELRRLVDLAAGDAPAQPAQAITWLKNRRTASTCPSQPTFSSDTLSLLQKRGIQNLLEGRIINASLRLYADDVTFSDVRQIEAQIPRGVLLLGHPTVARDLALWLANQLSAKWVETHGASLSELDARSCTPTPCVVFINDFDDVLACGGSSIQSFLMLVNQTDPTQPVFFVAQMLAETRLPAQIQRRLSLQLDIREG